MLWARTTNLMLCATIRELSKSISEWRDDVWLHMIWTGSSFVKYNGIFIKRNKKKTKKKLHVVYAYIVCEAYDRLSRIQDDHCMLLMMWTFVWSGLGEHSYSSTCSPFSFCAKQWSLILTCFPIHRLIYVTYSKPPIQT